MQYIQTITKHKRLPDIDSLTDAATRPTGQVVRSQSSSSITKQLWYQAKGTTNTIAQPESNAKHKQKLAFIVADEATRGSGDTGSRAPGQDMFEREKIRLLESQADNVDRLASETSTSSRGQVS